jgi:hypothetical protein
VDIELYRSDSESDLDWQLYVAKIKQLVSELGWRSFDPHVPLVRLVGDEKYRDNVFYYLGFASSFRRKDRPRHFFKYEFNPCAYMFNGGRVVYCKKDVTAFECVRERKGKVEKHLWEYDPGGNRYHADFLRVHLKSPYTHWGMFGVLTSANLYKKVKPIVRSFGVPYDGYVYSGDYVFDPKTSRVYGDDGMCILTADGQRFGAWESVSAIKGNVFTAKLMVSPYYDSVVVMNDRFVVKKKCSHPCKHTRRDFGLYGEMCLVRSFKDADMVLQSRLANKITKTSWKSDRVKIYEAIWAKSEEFPDFLPYNDTLTDCSAILYPKRFFHPIVSSITWESGAECIKNNNDIQELEDDDY